jgi:DNA-binding protein HU-beta
MNKEELTAQIAKRTKTSKTQVMSMVSSCFDEIEKALKKGEEVRLVGFGTWKKVKRRARPGRNPKTGQTLTIKARNVAKFSMGQQLFDALN